MRETIIEMLIIVLALVVLAFKFEELARQDETVKRYNALRDKTAVEKLQTDRRIDELEQQIRVLKQDMYIMQYGYESAE
jgi:hypothetical protein